MPETGLTLTYPELQAQVAYYLFGVDDPKLISKLEQRVLTRVIANGLRRFYYPAQADPELHHDWTFLYTQIQFKVEVGTQDYIMPFDFGGMVGPLHHEPTDNIRVSVIKTSAQRILMFRQMNISLSLWPMYYAERPVATGGRTSTRWQIMLWPSPSATYTFEGTQRLLPLAAGGSQPYLYGGPEHSQTIIEACLAQAELQLENKPGAHAAEFLSCLRSSIVMDQTAHAPETLGYNGASQGVNPALMRDGLHFENFTNVTVNGRTT